MLNNHHSDTLLSGMQGNYNYTLKEILVIEMKLIRNTSPVSNFSAVQRKGFRVERFQVYNTSLSYYRNTNYFRIFRFTPEDQ